MWLAKGAGRYPQPIALLARLGVHENHEGMGLYKHLIPEFEQSPTDDLHLVLLLKDIKRTLSR